jgi:hypothetical protein
MSMLYKPFIYTQYTKLTDDIKKRLETQYPDYQCTLMEFANSNIYLVLSHYNNSIIHMNTTSYKTIKLELNKSYETLKITVFNNLPLTLWKLYNINENQ